VTAAAQPSTPSHLAKSEVVSLRLEHVWKRFLGVTAVKDVSFAAITGEVHALLGENGAGKSTLMGICSGNVRPDAGTIEICGSIVSRLTAGQARDLGLAIVHQHPAVLPELTVAENMVLAVPPRLRRGHGSDLNWVASQLERVGCVVPPKTRMSEVDIAQRQLIELAKALAIEPKVLILDEPTAALTADLVELMFEQVRAAAARGAAIVYISHRLQEIRQIADRVTVMRDGEVKGSALVSEISDEGILQLIIGRTMKNAYPAKATDRHEGAGDLIVEHLSGHNFYDVSMSARGGEIVGIAGISGNGQSEFLAAIAGLVKASGTVRLGGRALRLGHPEAASKAHISYLSSDRQKEGLFMSLSVRENAALSALASLASFGVVRRSREYTGVSEQRADLDIRTRTIDTNVATLSGGNQQKVILARALLARAALILAEEPTAGVDMGARSEIYRILREVSNRGTPVVIVSSDVLELEGLCDRVLVFSRGHLVGELAGADVTEEGIGRLMVTATGHRQSLQRATRRPGDAAPTFGARLRNFTAGDYAPSVVLAILIVILSGLTANHNARFLSPFNIEKMLLLCTAVSFVGLGQMCAVFTGGIDLSVGPLVGLGVVIASFFFGDGQSALLAVTGLLAMFGVAALFGLTIGSLVRFGNFTSVAATLGVYIIMQGISVLLRPYPGGEIRSETISTIQMTVGSIPVAFILVVLLTIALELALRHTRWGLSLRAVGSDEHAASRVGVRTNWSIIGAYAACSLLSTLGAIMVVAQLGIGDPNQGISYTLSSVAAVVLGGASLFGGRGSFVGVLFGAVLLQVINSATSFLGLSQAWQYWFVGILTLGAVALYSQARRTSTDA
jgi:ribose transport system ATP-binding protein